MEFVLSSRNANFATTKKGWDDFFEPYFKEYRYPLLDAYDTRLSPPKFSRRRPKFVFDFYTRILKIDYYGYEIIKGIRQQSNIIKYSIPKFGLDGTMLSNLSALHKKIWIYNRETREEIESLISSLRLNSSYIGLQIRWGDKITEHDLFSVDEYINIIKSIENASLIRQLFILTDDYRAIVEFKEKLMDWDIQTLCNPNENGYRHHEHKKQNGVIKRKDFIKLFASMDILEKSEIFIGTYTANPSRNILFRRSGNGLRFVDSPLWDIW